MAHLKSVHIATEPWDLMKPELLGVGIFKDGELTSLQKEIDEKSGNCISNRISSGDFKGKKGTTLLLYSSGPAKRILLVGLGERNNFSLEMARQAGGTLTKNAQKAFMTSMIADVPGMDENLDNQDITQAFVEGMVLGSYKFLEYKSDTKDEYIMEDVTLLGNTDEKALYRGVKLAGAACLTRDLGSHPSNIVTPSKLEDEAQKLADEYKMSCTVFERDQIIEMGMGAFASVAKGTDEPPKFILLEYHGSAKGEDPIAFVGKGITFDSGGISIKPSAKMDEMKYDMCGAGTVMGIMKAVGELKPNKNIIGAIAATENMPGGHATKPGDIVKAYNGKTIEILNTDAEGRLVLADALAYVVKNYSPEYMVNFATLTGAVVIALGNVASGVMGTSDKLMSAVKKAGDRTGERVWELPLWEEYCKEIKSKIADIKNIGAPRQAGTIAGGAFLKEFVGDTPWVHMDIAGTAYRSKDLPYIPAGASGVGVRLSLELLNILE